MIDNLKRCGSLLELIHQVQRRHPIVDTQRMHFSVIDGTGNSPRLRRDPAGPSLAHVT